MKKFALFIIGVLIVSSGIAFGAFIGKQTHGTTTNQSVASAQVVKQEATPTTTTVPTKPVAILLPQTLRIPSLGVEAHIESVGMDKEGRMDIPKNADNVAWYNLGYKPGDKGSAVIAGHYDKVTGAPAVFYEIPKLKKGDKVIVTDTAGNEKTFAVVRIAEYEADTFPIKEVFGPSEKPMLNLITCQGSWNQTTKNYSHRAVIYTELVK